MKEIPLTQGKVALVDDRDYEHLRKFKWFAQFHHGNWYAVRTSRKSEGQKRPISMHTEILGTPKGMQTDHKDGNGLRNWRDNIRVCTHAQNQHNQQLHIEEKTSVFKGVRWDRKKWRAYIKFNNKCIHLGYFISEIQAALAYDEAAKKYFGEFACTNFIDV